MSISSKLEVVIFETGSAKYVKQKEDGKLAFHSSKEDATIMTYDKARQFIDQYPELVLYDKKGCIKIEVVRLVTPPNGSYGSLDDGVPNYFDPSKRGFQP